MTPFRTAILAGAASLVLASSIFAGRVSLAESGFSAKSLKGGYAFGFIGTDQTIGPVAGTGVITSTGNGQLSGTIMIKDGPVPCTESTSGKYTINSDGTGTGSVNVTNAAGGTDCTATVGRMFAVSLALAGGQPARQIKISLTDPQFAVLGTGDRQ